MSAEPEGVQDLLEQDATMWEGEGEDNAPQEGAGEAPGKAAQPRQQQQAAGAANGKGGQGAARRVPIPVPPKAASSSAGGLGSRQGEAQNGSIAGAKPPPAGARPAGGPEGGFSGRQPHRYFVLKSRSMFNVEQSVEKGIWATQVCRCDPRTQPRFMESCRHVLKS
jgi:hypothetical protein